jgi:hypothetical protein
MVREITARPLVRRIALAVILITLALAVHWRWQTLIDAQRPATFIDSDIYTQIAQRPVELDYLFYAKPPTVPLVYRAIGAAPAAIVQFQAGFAWVAWTVLTIALASVLRRRWNRAIAIFLGIAFLLAAPRVGFASAILSESINDSLLALLVACAIAITKLSGRLRNAAVIAGSMLAIAWMFARDTNVIVAVLAAIMAVIVWRGWRSRWAILGLVLTISLATVDLWSMRVVPQPLPFQQGWYAPMAARRVYPIVDNILVRVLPEERDRLPAGLIRYVEPQLHTDHFVSRDRGSQELQDWLVADGNATYLSWLIRHPLERFMNLIEHRRAVLGGRYDHYMPSGWVSHDDLDVVRSVTTSSWDLWALLCTMPLLLWRRADPLSRLALCMLASGLIGAIVAYFGDAMEPTRHCYGAGQQIVVAMFLALLAWLDRVQVPRAILRWRKPVRAAGSGHPGG